MVRGEKALLGDMSPGDVAMPSSAEADPSAIKKVVQLLMKAERPVIVAGEGVHWAQAGPELQELVELLQIPLHMRRTARGSVTEDHPLAFGGAYRSEVWRSADVMLIIGLRLGWLEWYGLPPAWPPDAKRIVVHESATDGWSPLPTEAFIVGNQACVTSDTDAARPMLKGTAQEGEWLAHLKECRETWESALVKDERNRDRKPMHPGYWPEVASFWTDATIVLDSFLGSTFSPIG